MRQQIGIDQEQIAAVVISRESSAAPAVEDGHRIGQLVVGQRQHRLVYHHHGQFSVGHRIAIGVGDIDVDHGVAAGFQAGGLRRSSDGQRAAEWRDLQDQLAGGVGRATREIG